MWRKPVLLPGKDAEAETWRAALPNFGQQIEDSAPGPENQGNAQSHAGSFTGRGRAEYEKHSGCLKHSVWNAHLCLTEQTEAELRECPKEEN